MFCSRCAGVGELFGNGMMLVECSSCLGNGMYEPESGHTKIDKKSKAYKNAINEIMGLNPDISRDKAIKMFEETYDKV